MVYTAAPPDYFDNDVGRIVQQAPSGVNPHEKERPRGEGKTDLYFNILGYFSIMTD
jgi:hypothetical protein